MPFISRHDSAFLKLASALGGRFLYAWIWNWWLAVCLTAIHLRARASSEPSIHDRVFFLVFAASLIFLTYRVLQSLQDRRPITVRVQVGLTFRLLVWSLPVFALLAVLAPIVIR